jgi:hypothetical protein
MSNWRSLTNGSATKNTGWRSLVPDYKPNSVSNTYSNDDEADKQNDDYTKYLKQLLAEQEKQRQLMSQQNAMNETQDSGVMSAQSAMRNGQTWQQKYQTYSDEIDKALNTPNAAYNASMNTQTRARNASQQSDASITTSAKLQQQMEQQVSDAKKQRAAYLPGLESKLNGESKPDEIVQAENSLKSPGNLLSNSGTDKNNVFSDSLGGVTPLKQYANNARTVKNYNESTHLTPSEELEYSQAKIEALSDGEQQALAGIKASQKSTGNYLSGGATGSYIKELQQINGSAKYYDTLKKDYGWDQNKIDEYTGYTQRLANAENTEENNQKFSINKDDSTLTKIGKSARNSAYSLANSGSSDYLSLLSSLEDKPKGFGKDSNSWTNSARNASDYAQEQVVNNAITDKHPVGQFAYNAGMSTAESGLNAIYGAAVGGALGSTGALANVAANTASLSQFAASAYNSAYDDARERGASDKQAQELGVINGLVEAGTEVVSLNKVWDLAKGNIRGARNILTNWLTQAGIEGSEEFAADILDKYADTMVLGKDGNSAKQKSIEAYMAHGMTEDDAKSQYDKDFLKQLGEDTLAGAVSGAVMGAGGLYAGSQNAKNDTARLNDIKNVYSNSKMEGNSDFAKSANTMADTYANNPTQYLADNVNDNTAEGKKLKQDLQKYADKENSGKKLSISDKNDIENILYENEQTPSGSDNSDYRDQLRYVPSEYRTPISNVSRHDVKTAMESAAQSGDVNALADAYQRGKMSTSADTRDNLEEDYGIAKRMLLNKGTVSTEDLDKATESQQDAYLSGLNGEESDVKSMSDRAATAYTAGYNQYVSNNANSKVGNDVDLHSVTAQDDSGRVTKVVGFASATSSNGQREISLKTTDGNSISYSNANISNTGVAKLYDNAAKQGTVDDMNAYLDNYVKEMPIGQYDNAFNRYYSQGASGTKSFDDLYSSDKYGYKSFMSKNQLQKIYNIGANETAGQLLENAKAEGKSIAVKGTGAVTDLRHNRSDSSYMPFVSSMAKALNLDVVLSDNMEDGINGQFERSLQRVTLNTKNKDAMFNTVFHEAFGEYMQAHNAAGANRVRSAVLSYISDTKGADYVSSVGKTYQKAYTGVEGTKTFSDALGESVNDSISGIFSTEEGIHDLRTWLDSKYDEKKSRGILGDIADYFKGVAASLRSLIKDGHLSTASRNTAEMAEKRASDIRKMILKEMDTAAKNAAGTTVDASTKGKANYSVVVDTQGNALTEGQRDYFKNAKTVDENGNLKVFYHGTARADRVGYTFRPDRATSGPMAFFTDNKDIANNYAKDKSDTSLSRDSRYDSYSTQFRVSDGKTDKQISDAWYKLSAAEKKSITDKALSLTEDGDGNIIANKDNRDGLGDLSYKIKSHRGNLISALVEEWLDDGTLFNEESKFTEVLDKAGITEALKKKGFGVEYLDPEARNEGVYEVYLNLTNPYDTSNVSKEDYNGIASWWSNTYQSAYENINYAADPWDKTSTSMDTWLDRLSRGIENGDTHVWTVVPDAVTAYLKEKGYDGILDTGGKNGGLVHTVAIPFYSNQIKNIDNQNPSKHDDIRYSLDLGYHAGDLGKAESLGNQSGGLDNTAYGSVIYDLKGKDKQRKEDIGTARYSLDVDDSWDDIVSAYDEQEKDSANNASSILAEGASALKNTQVDKTAVRKVASEIIRNTGSSYGVTNLTDNLEKVFAYMQSTDNVDYNDLVRVLEEVAQPVVDAATTKVGVESYKEFTDALKGYNVRLTSKQLEEVKSAFGTLTQFKRLVPGMKFSQNETTGLDSVWSELVAMSNGALDYDTNEGDMPAALADAVETLKPKVRNNFGANMAYDTALNIVEKYFDVSAKDAASADAKEKINQAKAKMAEENRAYLAKVKSQYDERVKEERKKALASGNSNTDAVIASLKEKQQQALDKLRTEMDAKRKQELGDQLSRYQKIIANITKQKNDNTLNGVASVRAANDKRYQKAAERRKAMHEKAMIDSSATKLFKWLTSPTDTYHIPNDLQKAVSDYISGIDFLSPQINSFTDPKSKTTKYQVSVYDHEARKFVKKVANTQAEAYQIYQNAIEAGLGTRNDRKWRDRMSTLSTLLSKGEMSSDDTTMNDFLQGVDASLAEDFEKILKDNDNTVRLSDLSSSDLHTINMLTRNVMSAINHINKAFTSNARISDLAESTINSETKSRKEHGKTVNDLLGLLQVKNATPETYFHFLGKGGQKVYKMLRSDGLNQRTRDVRTAGDYMKGVLKGISRVDKWSTDTHEFDTIDNKKIQLNTAQIMTLYEYTKREQAMMHLPGGFSVEKTKINGKEVTQKGLHLSDAQIENIAGTLTEEQKTVADKMQQFMATECSEWGNRASRSMFGYDKFGDKDYFPIRTEESTHQTQNNNVSNDFINSIKNQGFTKQVVINANNPLVLSDIFDVFTRHVTGMAAYDAYAPAISDALRWYNYRTVETGKDGYKSYGNTVKDAISRVYGDEGKRYFVKLIQNINGNEKGGSELNVIDKAITGFKASAVGANLRVVIQQPTAYFRANNVLSPKYLTQAMLEMKAYSSDAKAAYKMQDQTSDISWWKSQGYWETSIGKSTKAMITGSETALDKSKNTLMALAGKADDITWRKLYLATYLEQKSAFGKAGKSIDGVDFENAVNDRFDEMIDRTQVVDSTLHRSQLMRSNDTKDKLFTSFMSEPTKSYNMLMRAAYDAYSDKDHARGAKIVARAAVTYFVTSLATECAASLFDATRNDDDKDWWEKYLASLTENYIDDLNPLSLIPFAKDISELVSPYAKKWIAELTGNTDEESTYTTSSEDMSIAAITNLLDAANTDMQYLFQHTSTLTPYGILKKNARALSQITGIPVYNIIRDSVAVYNTLSDVGNWKKLYSKQSDVKAYYKREFTSSIESGTGIEKALDDYVANGQKLESAENMITDAYKEEYLNLYNEDPEKAKAFADKLNKAYTEVDKLSGAEHDVDKDTTRYENWLKNSDAGKKEKADVFTSIDNGGDYKKEINDALEAGYSYDSIKSSLTSTYKPKFIEAYKSNKSDAAKIKNRLAEVYAYLSDQTGTYKGKSHAYKVKQYSKDIDDWLK